MKRVTAEPVAMRIDLEQDPPPSAEPLLTLSVPGANPSASGWRAISRAAAGFDERSLASVCKGLSALFLTIYTLRFAAVPNGLFLYAQDDFFYYLKIADRILAGHGISFDGQHATNGFHPLWLAIILPVRAMAPRLGDFQLLFSVLLTVLTLATFWAALRALARMTITSSPFAAIFLATVYVFLFEKYSHAMEIKVIGLLYPLYLEARRRRTRMCESVISGLLVLARLDFVLYFVVPGIVTLAKERRINRNILVALSPAVVFGLYALWSHLEFGMWMPISSAIKQLKDGLIFNPTAFPIGNDSTDRLLVTAPFALNLVLLAWSIRKRMFDRPFFAPLAFCAIFYAVLAATSNWPLWPWYYYPIFLCVLHYRQIGEAVFDAFRWPAEIGAGSKYAFALATIFLWVGCGGLAARATLSPPSSPILQEAQFLAEFDANHPGIYGIGDRAGIPSMLMRSPVVQLEGLVMDRYMLELIGNRTPLCRILADYHVRYYVSRQRMTSSEAGACQNVVEPLQATLLHPSASVPVSLGMFCAAPLATFKSWENSAPLETAIYNADDCR
jgi:hypothetical protein